MDEQELRDLVTRVKEGRVSRRAFVHKLIGLGLTANEADDQAQMANCSPPSSRVSFTTAPNATVTVRRSRLRCGARSC